jgi:hypothetical protein
MKDNGGCFTNAFLILGLIALALTLTYRLGFYANYLNMDNSEVIFDWTGGEQDVWVYTDANSWVIEDEEYISWATFQNWGDELHIYAYQNNSKEDRSSWVRIRSGFVEGIGNEYYSLKVVQKGKQATYLNASKQTVSFSERGGSESLQIRTDGDGWYVTDCPSWITKSVSGNTLVLKVSANSGKSPREGSVKLKSDEVVTTINVTQESSYVLSISSIKIGNVYKGGSIETNYGNTLYSSYTMYLKPRVSYYGYKTGWFTLYQKLYTPFGLSTGSSSPSGYTTKTDVYLSKGSNTMELSGWGNERMGNWSSGWYRYEIWYNGQCLASESFYIY